MNEQINELIAEHVLGWTKPPATSVLKPMWVAPPMGKVYQDLPNFSEDIADARLIVDKLCYEKVETAFKLELFYKGYWATFEINETQYFSGQQPTECLAICLAALKAVGVDTDHLVNKR